MISAWFDDEAEMVVVAGIADDPSFYNPRTLVAFISGDAVMVRTTVAARNLASADYRDITDRAGNRFPSPEAAQAYLQGVFDRRRRPPEGAAYPMVVSAPGQSTIPLPSPPLDPASVRVEVNGIAYRPPDVLVSDTAVTWANPDFPLDPTDAVVVIS